MKTQIEREKERDAEFYNEKSEKKIDLESKKNEKRPS